MTTRLQGEADGQQPAPLPVHASVTLGEYLTYKEAGAVAGLHRSTIHKAVVAGELRRYGGVRSARFRADEFRAWVERPLAAPVPSLGSRLAGLPDVGLRW